MPIKKIATIFISLILVIATIIYGIAFSLIPTNAQKSLKTELQNLGFNIAPLPSPETRIGGLRFHDIDLDPEGRSSIENLTIHYNAWDIITRGTFKALDIQNMVLSGNIDKDGNLSITGMPTPAQIINLKNISTQTINIQNATISLLTAQLGGIRFSIDAQILDKKNEITWTGLLKSEQNQLELVTKMTGSMKHSGIWQTDIEIENGKIERDFGKITRLSGYTSIYADNLIIKKITSDIKSGGMTLMDLPWQNIALTANGTPDKLNIFMSGKSLGIADLELGFEGEINHGNFLWNARIFAPNTRAAFDYLKLQDNFQIPDNIINDNKIDSEIELIFQKRQNDFLLNIRDADNNKTTNQYILKQQSQL